MLFLWIMLFLYYNHYIYKAYLKITYRTLYHDIKPIEWLDFLIDKEIRNNKVLIF